MAHPGELTDEAADDSGPDTRGAAYLALPVAARDYLIPASDDKGRSHRIYCRVMPQVSRLIGEVLASKQYPFRTSGDLMRWCVLRGTKQLLVGAGIDSVFSRVDTMIEQLVEEEYQLQFLEFFKKTQEIVDHYIVAGAPGEARRVVAAMKMRIEAMPDAEAYWKRRYADELMTRYRAMLDAPDARAEWDYHIVDAPATDAPTTDIVSHD